jgi:hypothetical protein
MTTNAKNFVFEIHHIVGTFIYRGINRKKELDPDQQDYVKTLVTAAADSVIESKEPITHHRNTLMLANIAHIINSL